MFESISILLSFVYAIALTHLLTSATELLWARERVRFSGLYAIWLMIIALNLVINWLSFSGLSGMTHWSTLEVMIQFAAAVIQYFTCSLISIRPKDEGVIDLPAFYDRERPLVMAAFLLLTVVAIVINYRDAGFFAGLGADSWIAENSAVVAMAATVAVAGWARPIWLQWAAATCMVLLTFYFLALYAIPG
jgi:hypothetical protein